MLHLPLRKTATIVLATVLLSSLSFSALATESSLLDNYNVVWSEQSKQSSESMPVGGGDTGLNVWAEKGDLFFYIGRDGTFDENNQMLKLGRVRLQLNPNPFAPDGEFTQELNLRQGEVILRGKAKNGNEATVKVWVEVFRPVVHVDVLTTSPVAVSATYESWRTRKRLVTDRMPCTGLGKGPTDERNYPGDIFNWPDQVRMDTSGVLFFHRNNNYDLTFDKEARQQGIDSFKDKIFNPLKDRTFGGLMTGQGFTPDGITSGTYAFTDFKGWKLSAKPAKAHNLKVFLHTAQAPTAQEWEERVRTMAAEAKPTNPEAKQKNADWWDAFWNRSYIKINPTSATVTTSATELNTGWTVGRNYQLFRFLLGCNAYGEFPTKFNGSFFTTDPHYAQTPEPTPDYRLWGGGTFTAQNQRLVYWPMLKMGDFDMMIPQFNFYKCGLPAAMLWVEKYWGHKGAWFAEQLNNFGTPFGLGFNWHRDPETEPGVQDNISVRYHMTGQIEFALMILDYERFTGNDISAWMPFITESIRFMDEHYQYRAEKRTGKPLDDKGKLILFPSQALESFRGATNPVDQVAGLQVVLTRMLELPEKYISKEDKKQWAAMIERVPEIPIENTRKNEKGEAVRTIAPADKWESQGSSELPQLYPVFPYGLYGIGKPDLQLAIDTWKYSDYIPRAKRHFCWFQGGIFTARLGLTDEAKAYAEKKFLHPSMKFPAFWINPRFDQEPDCDHGGCAMIGLQEMLMQTDGKTIRLLPAWPKDWDVDFKLHAPYATVVEGSVRNGKVINLTVSPPERKGDVIITE